MLGRDDLLEEVCGLVLDHRLVVLSGPGGVGKTRLALEAAPQLVDAFTDGVWLIDLSSVTDAASVPEAMATALGVVRQGEVSAVDAVADAAAGRRLLLVVDNCEHLAPAVTAAVCTILDRSATPKVLATSRESLWISGEQRVSVAPLATGGPGSPATTLFVERARAVRRDFAADDPATAEAVAEICRTLDGLPLAIELAAARMTSMTAPELRDLLAHRFELLTGAKHRPDRQRTLERTVAWSYDLLAEPERRVLLAAAVFLGGFHRDDLAAVLGDADPVDALTQLGSLVNKSLVVADAVGPTTRYRLLETIRHFAEARLTERAELEALRDRHAAHFANAARTRWAHWNGPEWRETCDWLLVELANLRAAFRWSSARGQIDVATDVAAHSALMGVSVHLFETVEWAEALLDDASHAGVTRLPRLYTAAGYACFAGRAPEAVDHAHTATLLELESGRDPCEPGLATFVEALASVYSGDLARYVELAGRVAAAPSPAPAYGLPAYVDGLQASGCIDEAVALADDAVAAALEVGSPFWIAYALWTVGVTFAHVDPERARLAWDEGVAVVHEHRVEFFEGFIARDAGRLRATGGDVEASLPLLVVAIESFQRAGNVAQLIITVASIPVVLEQVGAVVPAATLLAAIRREPASAHHVPMLDELDRRLDEQLDAEQRQECRTRGADLDLSGAATYAREQLVEALAEIGRTRRGGAPGGLTRREIDVVRLVADGHTTGEIARRLFISAKTADHHIQHIYTKLGVSNRVAVARWAMEQGVVVAADP